jgi:2-C-methyl-D-erythritol 4-phosphate cytidylyltransferase
VGDGTWGIVLAAGRGTRFGGAKQFARVGGRALVDVVVDAVGAACDAVVVVLPDGEAWQGKPVAAAVTGGATRAASVRAGLAAVPAAAEIVVIHDPAHPLAAPALFHAVITAVREGADAAAPGIVLDEPIKRVDAGGVVTATVPRGDARLIQTPHAFRAQALRDAHAGEPDAPEDTELVAARGGSVVVVPGDPRNLPVTGPEHLEMVQRLLGDGAGDASGQP